MVDGITFGNANVSAAIIVSVLLVVLTAVAMYFNQTVNIGEVIMLIAAIMGYGAVRTVQNARGQDVQ